MLFHSLGRTFTDKEFDELCFEFGIELDEVVTETRMKRKQEGSEEKEVVVYKIDVPANRQDLLCLEGISRALRIFMGKEDVPMYRAVQPKQERIKMYVSKETKMIRPYVVCAVLRNIHMTHDVYNSFLDLQDKLHFNIGRRRSLVAIGTHNLDSVQPPFYYKALPAEKVVFQPLNQTREFNAHELMDFYRDPKNDCKHLAPYTDLIYDSPVVPVIVDSNGTVLSLPPLINGNHSKMDMQTENIFIECTAKDVTKASIVLNTLIAMFSEYCDDRFTAEVVEVEYEKDSIFPEGKSLTYPDFTEKQLDCSVLDMCSTIGATIPVEQVQRDLHKMQLASEVLDADHIRVTIPITRSDVIHAVDVYEDVAIAYGYNNIKRSQPPTLTIGAEQPVNQLSDMLRAQVAMAGYTEVLTLSLCSKAENYALMGLEDDGLSVRLANPKTVEFEVCRTSLLPGILKTFRENKHVPYAKGVKLFEVSDVVLKDPANYVGARNERRLCAVYMGQAAQIEIIHGLMDRIMRLLDVYPMAKYSGLDTPIPEGKKQYYIREGHCGTFFPGRCCDIVVVDGEKENVVGHFGVLHPKVVKNFELRYPGSAIEMSIESFV